jgi:hypothetical protein
LKPARLRIGIAAAWCDVAAAQHLADRLAGAGRQVELICAGAPDSAPGPSPPDVVLVLWSPGAATSLFVRRAADEARSRGRLVEACLKGSPPGGDREAPPLMIGPRPSVAMIARVAARLSRAAKSRPQQSAVLALAGPAALAAALAAAVAAPFIWLALEEAPPQVAAANFDGRPMPSRSEAPSDPKPQGSGMGGPLIPAEPTDP